MFKTKNIKLSSDKCKCTVVNIAQGDFPGGPVVRTSPSNAGDTGSILSWGAKIPYGLGPKIQNIKNQKQYGNK